MRTRKRSRRERGTTLMEMIVVVAIFSVVFIISYSLLEDTVKTSLFIEAHTDLPVYGQQAVNTIQRELLQTRTVYEGTAGSLGPAYFAALTLPAQYPLLTDSQMPVLNPVGTLIPDTAGTRFTGNCLLIVRQLAPAVVTNLANGCATSGTCKLLVDRYQFELFYLTKVTGGRSFSGTGYWLDAIQAKSAIYADFTQLTQWAAGLPVGTAAADKARVASVLSTYTEVNTGLSGPATKAWDSSAAAPSAFYTITATMGLTSIASPTIPLTTSVSLARGLAGGRVSGKMDYSVGFRPSAATRFNLSTDVTRLDGTIQVRDPVPEYAVFNPATPLFPSGMEFLMVGPAGSRRILTRIVMMSSYIGHIDSKEAVVITSGSS
jgi:prepilin-type N-terminal cleavage/methylation domain-containing protein